MFWVSAPRMLDLYENEQYILNLHWLNQSQIRNAYWTNHDSLFSFCILQQQQRLFIPPPFTIAYMGISVLALKARRRD